MCQEIAHDFGLDHQDENFDNPNLGSCMDYTSDPDGPPSNEHPNSHDFQQIAAIYSHWTRDHRVGSALPQSMPPAMGQISTSSRPVSGAAWCGRTGSGRIQIFELDFGPRAQGGHARVLGGSIARRSIARGVRGRTTRAAGCLRAAS